MDRMVRGASNSTPAKLYIDSVAADLTTPEIQVLRDLTRTVLSLFEVKKIKEDSVKLLDILTGEKYQVTATSTLFGAEPGDIIAI